MSPEEIKTKLDDLERQYEREIDQVFIKLNSELGDLQVEPKIAGPLDRSQEIPKEPASQELTGLPEKPKKEKFKVPKHWKAPNWRDTWRYRGLKGLASRLWQGSDPEKDVTWRYINPKESNRRQPTLQEYAALQVVVGEIVDEYFVLEEGTSEEVAAVIQRAKDEIKQIVSNYVRQAHQIGQGLSMNVSALPTATPIPSEPKPEPILPKPEEKPKEKSKIGDVPTPNAIPEPESMPEPEVPEPEVTPEPEMVPEPEVAKKKPDKGDRKPKLNDLRHIVTKQNLIEKTMDKDIWDKATNLGFKPWTWFAWSPNEKEWEQKAARKQTNEIVGLTDFAMAAHLGLFGDVSKAKSALKSRMREITGGQYLDTQNVFSKLRHLLKKKGKNFTSEKLLRHLDDEINERGLRHKFNQSKPKSDEIPPDIMSQLPPELEEDPNITSFSDLPEDELKNMKDIMDDF